MMIFACGGCGRATTRSGGLCHSCSNPGFPPGHSSVHMDPKSMVGTALTLTSLEEGARDLERHLNQGSMSYEYVPVADFANWPSKTLFLIRVNLHDSLRHLDPEIVDELIDQGMSIGEGAL